MRPIVSIAVLVIAAVIIGDLLTHPTGTKNIIDGITSLWTTSVKGAAGSYSTPGG